MEQKQNKNEKMKNAGVNTEHSKSIKVIKIVIFILIVLAILLFRMVAKSTYNSYKLGDIKGLRANSAVLEKTNSVYMILNELETIKGTHLVGNKINVNTDSDLLAISFYNAVSGTEINEDEDGNIEVPEEGVKLKIDGIKDGENYAIEVEAKESIEDYHSTFKKVTIIIDATTEEIEAYIQDITKEVNGEEVKTLGSEDKTAIFTYEDENGKIKINGNKDVEIYYYIVYGKDGLGREELEQLEEEQWQLYNSEKGLEVEKNGKVYSRSKYKNGGYSGISEITVNNIDKLPPSINVTGKTASEGKATISISMQDQEATDFYGKSGIYGYAITSTQSEPEDFIACEDTAQIEGIIKNGTYYVWASDKAGNTAYTTVEVTELETEEKKTVAIILESPVDSLVGTEYNSLNELMEALDREGITEESGRVVVQIVADIANSSAVIENKNIVIDLNGYTITSILPEPTIRAKSGKTVIVDNKYNIEEYITDSELAHKYSAKADSNGKVYNEKYVAIQVGNKATVSLGEIEGKEGAVVEVEGGLEGVSNLNGTFNMYSGKILVKSTTGISHTYGIYNKREGKVVMEGGEIALATSIPNIYLYGIYNYSAGDITISDGIITGTNTNYYNSDSYGIYNYGKGTIRLTEGTINMTSMVDVYGIYNDGVGNVEVEEVTIDLTNTTDKCPYGIYNNGLGSVNIKGGDITAKGSSSRNVYGIYNNGEGIVSSGANITLTGSHTCAIYNANSGNIEVTNGIISSIQRGITNDGTGSVKVSGGDISITDSFGNSNNAVIWNSNTGEIIIEDGNINNNTSSSYTMYNEGRGNINILGGTINSSNYGIYNKDEGNITIYGGNIIKKGNGSGLDTLSALYNAALGSIIVEGGTITTKDMNGYAPAITNEGEGNIVVKEGNLESDYAGIYNKSSGTITIEGGTINSGIGITRADVYGIRNSSGNMTIKGCNINIDNGLGIYSERGDVVIDSITINQKATNCSELCSIYTKGESISIKNSTIDLKVESEKTATTVTGIKNMPVGNGNIEIEGNTINVRGSDDANINKLCAIENSNADITIKGCNIDVNNGWGIQNTSGNIEMDNVTINQRIAINSSAYTIYTNGKTAKIKDSIIDMKIESESISSPAIGIDNANDIMEIEGGSIRIHKSCDREAYAISNNRMIKIDKIDVQAIDEGTEQNIMATAIINNGGCLVMGKNDQEVNTETPSITGTKFGVINTGTILFYDGIVKGGTDAISNETDTIPRGTVTVPEGYQVKNEQQDSMKVAILEASGSSISKTSMLSGYQMIYKNKEMNRALLINRLQNRLTETENKIDYDKENEQRITNISNYETSTLNQLSISNLSNINQYKTTLITAEDRKIELSLEPKMEYNSEEWTNNNVVVNIEADIIPTLDLYSQANKPPLSYSKTATVDPGIAHQTLETIETVGASIARPEGLELTETEVTAGDTITYTIQVHNEGEIEAKEVIVQDTVPMGTKLVQAENEGKEQDGEITWTIPTIEAGQTAEVSFIVEVEYAKEEYTIENTATVDGEETNTTQNQYKKPIAQLTSSLEKTTEQTVITSKQENVCYEIKFNANVNDFVGKTKVTIVDTLPYPIDKNSSTLLDGDYDEDNHTITWEIEESNINTFEQGEQKTVTITKEISLKYDYTSLRDVNEPIRNEVESTIELLEEDEESDEGYIIVKTDDQSSQVESTMEIPAEVIVHHYIYDDEAELEEDKYTEEELIADERKEGIVGREYETSKSSEVPKNYVCINDEPEKHSGIYKEEPIEVKYYYRLLTPTIEKSVTKEVTSEKNKEGEVVLTKEDGEVSYKITYNTTITNYIGKATIKIVDQLPAKINKDKSELAGGVYSEDNRTITWTKEVEIDTFEDGKYKEKIVKEIKLVYTDQDVTQNLVNAVKGETITYYPEGYPNKDDNQEFAKEEIEDNISIKQDYRANFKVVKVWDDDEDSRGNRPQSVKITITVDQVGKSTTQILNEDNNWTYEETNLPKYNELTGEKITYTITESETNEGELQYYKQPVITITEKQNEEATNYTYTVTNSYKLKEADFNIEMSKVGPSEITNKNDKVAYTINFNAEIPDYTGKAKVTLVDTLPFAINKANSKLDDGDYDEETNTITWVEELDIDTEELGTSYKIDITKEIELAYIGIDLTQESIVNEVKGTVILEGTDEIDIEATTSNTDINVQGKVIVRYVDKNTGKDIVGASSARPDGTYTYEITGKVGSTYNAEVKTFDNYDYIDEGKATGTIKEGKEEIILYYTKAKLKVLVKYQDKEGNSISEDVLIEGYIGDIYKTEQKEIENYRFVEVKGKTEGVMTEREIIITYIYEKIEIGEVTVKYVDIDTDEEIIGSSNARPEGETYGYTITGYVGDEYETEEKEIPYYVLVKSTDNTEGTLTDTEITVIYYYRKKVFNFSMEKTISKITLNGEELRVKDNKLVKVELKPSQIENSELILSYNIKVTNEGELAGKVKALEKIPKGFEIVTKEDWIEREDGNLETEVELDVEESKDLTVMLRWTNSENNLGPMKNTVELIESNNIANYEDTYEENDTSEATILISIKTGWKVSTMIIVTMLSSMVITGYLILVIIRNFGKGPNIKNIKFLNR